MWSVSGGRAAGASGFRAAGALGFRAAGPVNVGVFRAEERGDRVCVAMGWDEQGV